MQGPYFSEVELANFAQELDSLERQLLAEAGLDSVDFLQHVGGVSANVADDGMFSVQVRPAAAADVVASLVCCRMRCCCC